MISITVLVLSQLSAPPMVPAIEEAPPPAHVGIGWKLAGPITGALSFAIAARRATLELQAPNAPDAQAWGAVSLMVGSVVGLAAGFVAGYLAGQGSWIARGVSIALYAFTAGSVVTEVWFMGRDVDRAFRDTTWGIPIY